MRVLVTGGDGFIGRSVCTELAYLGHEPVRYDLKLGHDVRNLKISDGRSYPIGAVIHLAGVLGTSELFDAFDEAVDTNIKGTQRVLEFCLARQIPFVGITLPPVWANVYQATKACSKVLATAYHESFGVSVSHVLAFNAHGPGQAYGPGHPQKILPTFASLAWAGEDIPIWGDGEQTVDLVTSWQVAQVLVDAMDFGDDQVFDAGTGVEVTVNEVAERVIKTSRSTSKIVHLPMRAGERPATHLAATGQGWDLLKRHPHFYWSQVNQTVWSYKP